MKKDGAFVIFLIMMVLLVIFGVYVLFAGLDSYRNRTLIEERTLRESVVSYVVPHMGMRDA